MAVSMPLVATRWRTSWPRLGIDSVMASAETRQRVNVRLAQVLADPDVQARLDALTTEVPLADVPELAPQILAGQVKGRVVVACR